MKILFTMRDLDTGGVQKSLIDLLKCMEDYIDLDKDKIDLLVLKKYGQYVNDVPKYVNVIEANKDFWYFGVSQKDAKKFGFLFKIKRIFKALESKIFGNKRLLNKALKNEKILGKYDKVISYSISISNKGLYSGWSEIALNKTISKEKIAFIHNDFVASRLNNSFCLNLLKSFDKIFFVSKSCMNSFIQNYPEFIDKCDYFYNIVNTQDVINKSNQFKIKYSGETLNIVSVSRLSEEKGHLRSLQVFNILKKEGYKFKWHILGDGPMFNKIKKTIRKYNLKDHVLLYGNKQNPYPYIKAADLFYLGSFNESFGLVLIESMLLGVSPVTTNTISAGEILGEYGFICDNTEQGIYKVLKSICEHREQINDMSMKFKTYKYENNNKIILKLLEVKNDT